MKRRVGDLKSGDVIIDHSLGRCTVDWITILPTGDVEIFYSRSPYSLGVAVFIAETVLEVEEW